MAAATTQTEVQQSPAVVEPAPSTTTTTTTSTTTSCWKKNSYENASFFEGFKNHVVDFYRAPLAEHKECFKTSFNNRYQQIFGKSEDVAEKKSESQDVGGSLPVEATSSAN